VRSDEQHLIHGAVVLPGGPPWCCWQNSDPSSPFIEQ
jgi:hypothetical protein